ncbi:hypothetical protein TorRG33x02_152190, partial [Trema orientale]
MLVIGHTCRLSLIMQAKEQKSRAEKKKTKQRIKNQYQTGPLSCLRRRTVRKSVEIILGYQQIFLSKGTKTSGIYKGVESNWALNWNRFSQIYIFLVFFVFLCSVVVHSKLVIFLFFIFKLGYICLAFE